jgi:NAD(P)-dependent dehydrogenase (short-subunit alcohol dehydrogenase family)
MAIPRALTGDGFEMQLGVNHFGHFSLTGLLLGPLQRATAARVVTVSSQAHRMGKMRFDDLDGAKSYDKWQAYGQSKLAILLFAFELHRRLSPSTIMSLACHPGYAATNLQLVGPELERSALKAAFFRASNAVFAQSAASGAQPTLRAATDPQARGGECYGPGGPLQFFGAPRRVEVRKRAHDPELAKRLWEISVERTGVRYEALSR